jgi:dolichyl-phosphate beta-glucosyltransferase
VQLVIPCYNEADRLSEAQLEALLADPRMTVLLVDDGSEDATAEVLADLSARHERIDWLGLQQNGGKGEAVRQGLLHATAAGAEVVGYADADFATPPTELSRLLDVLHDKHADAVLGSRVSRLGARIDRRPRRHYLGRVFATTASLILGLAIYDTQCGAKLFRSTPALAEALATPFRSRWAFDVELLGRLTRATCPMDGAKMVEVPLEEWIDVAGSKMSLKGALRGGVDLLGLGLRVRRRGRDGFYR